MAVRERTFRCQLWRLLHAAWRHRPSHWPGRGARDAWRRVQAVDFEALALRLHGLERQLGQLRHGYAGKHLSHQQLEALCRCILDEAHALLRPLDSAADAVAPSWATQRLRAGLRHWQERAAAVSGQPLHQSDLGDLQERLLEVTTALVLCARVDERGDRW
jgi:hypothetical protein